MPRDSILHTAARARRRRARVRRAALGARVWRAALALPLLALLTLLLAAPAPAPAADRVVAPVSGVSGILALDDHVLLRHRKQWTRVVAGRRSEARGVPPEAEASTIGRDARGRVVVTFSRRSDKPRPDRRWWLYDVARDTARRFTVDTPRRCYAESLAVWRSRIAYGETCWEIIDDLLGPMVGVGGRRVVLEVAGRPRRTFPDRYVDLQIALRGRSLAAVMDHDDAKTVRRFVDRGRACPAQIDAVDAEYYRYAAIGLGAGRLVWSTSFREWDGVADYDQLLLTDVPMRGGCADEPQVGVVATDAPADGVEAIALDGRRLYYATGDGVFERRLRRPGTTAPPANDDFADAAELATERPVEVWGRVGYATREPGEPPLRQVEATTWYTWRPTVSRRVHVFLGSFFWQYRLFTGDRVDALSPASEVSTGTGECPLVLDERAGERYSLQVGAFVQTLPTATLQPFFIRIHPADEPLPSYCTPA